MKNYNRTLFYIAALVCSGITGAGAMGERDSISGDGYTIDVRRQARSVADALCKNDAEVIHNFLGIAYGTRLSKILLNQPVTVSFDGDECCRMLPLAYATMHKADEVVMYLVRHGALVSIPVCDVRSGAYYDSLYEMIRTTFGECELVDYVRQAYEKEYLGTQLMGAIRDGDISGVKILIEEYLDNASDGLYQAPADCYVGDGKRLLISNLVGMALYYALRSPEACRIAILRYLLSRQSTASAMYITCEDGAGAVRIDDAIIQDPVAFVHGALFKNASWSVKKNMVTVLDKLCMGR